MPLLFCQSGVYHVNNHITEGHWECKELWTAIQWKLFVLIDCDLKIAASSKLYTHWQNWVCNRGPLQEGQFVMTSDLLTINYLISLSVIDIRQNQSGINIYSDFFHYVKVLTVFNLDMSFSAYHIFSLTFTKLRPKT